MTIRKEKPSLFKTIAEWLKQFAENIRKAFEGMEARSREAKAMNDALEELTRLCDTAAVAAAKSEGNKKTPGKGEGVKYSKKPENSTIKNQIAASSERLNAIAPVATVNASNLPKGGKNVRAWAVNLLKATGYKVDRQNFGTIEFSPKHIAEGIKYLSEDAELAAFSALPKVLKRGIIIDSHEKHKGNLRDSVTIAAPIVINGVRGNMAVAITVTTKNHYHVHRVVMPDGSKFTFDVNKKEAEPTMYSAAKAGEETKSSTYNENVPQAGRKVKYSQRDSSEGLTKEEARAQAQAYTVLKAENAYYRERWEWWKNQTRKTKVATVRKADTDRYARYLVNLHDAKEAEKSQYFNPWES